MSVTFRATVFASALTAVFVPAVCAQTADRVFDAMRMDDMVEILKDEGLSYGNDIAAELFSGQPSVAWTAAVDAIFDTGVMADTLRAGLRDTLDDDDSDAILQFYTSAPGPEILSLELSARQAFLDPSVEAAAIDASTQAVAAGGPRIDLMNDYIAANDLIEMEVATTMNSSAAFYLGLLDGGALPASMSEADILRDVYDRQDDIRSDITERVYAYLYLAYQPLSDDQIDAYVAFMESPAGRSLNTALYATFDQYYLDASRQLALAAAAEMKSEDL